MTSSTHKGGMLAALLAAPFLAQADATIANVATPTIHADLGASGTALELVIGGYLIAFAVLLITGARLGHTYGHRRVFLAGLGTFVLASLACGLAPDPTLLIAARVLQGSGAALMFPQTLTGIQLHTSGSERTRAIALYALALSTGAVIGQIVGGVLISANPAGLHWRAIFLVNVPIGAAALLAAVRYLPADAGRPSRRLDVVGVGLLSASVQLLVLPLVLGRAEGWPAWVWLCMAASAPAFGLFLRTERGVAARGASPVVNVHVFARPVLSWTLVTLFAATGTYYALLFTLAQYLQDGLARSGLVSELTLVPWVAAFGLAGQLVRRLPPALAGAAPAAGCVLLAGAYVAMSAMLFAHHHAEGPLMAVLAAGGFGLGVQFNALLAHATGAVPRDYAPDISGVTTTTSHIGGAVGVAAFGTLYLGVAHAGATHAFAVVSLALAAIASFASVTAWRATGRA